MAEEPMFLGHNLDRPSNFLKPLLSIERLAIFTSQNHLHIQV
jgi:hypothetical protein